MAPLSRATDRLFRLPPNARARIIQTANEAVGRSMNECCSSSGPDDASSKDQPCPLCGHESSGVSARTITHHIRDAWAWRAGARRYFFCDEPACVVVYFGDDGSMIDAAQLRTRVGLKEGSGGSQLCYCFGVTRDDFSADPATRDFVVAQTAARLCSCETRNPSGRCCLKDFPRPAA